MWLAIQCVTLGSFLFDVNDAFAGRYNPVFVIPVPESVPETPNNSDPSTPIIHTPGRRTGTGSANVQAQPRAITAHTPITGFKEVSLLSMINFTGRVPVPDSIVSTLEDIRQRSARPVVVFPECTTSNGRGMLRFAEVFRQTIPVKGYQVFIMSIRCVLCVVCVASWLILCMQI